MTDTQTPETLADAVRRAAHEVRSKPNGGTPPPLDMRNATDLTAQAFLEMYEEAARRAEQAIEAEIELHQATVAALEENAAKCREAGKAIADWLGKRGETAAAVTASAQQSTRSLELALAATRE